MLTLDELRTYLIEKGIEPSQTQVAKAAVPSLLPVRVPRYYLDLIDWKDPDDPILRQVLPLRDEALTLVDDLRDPIGDGPNSPVPGIVHRYPDRVLFLLTATCAIHCRFCFRREFIGKPVLTLRRAEYQAALEYVGTHPEIWEVILSGGDPLVFPDAYLRNVLGQLRAIPHVRIIRLHSRIPAILPSRLTVEFAEMARQVAPVYLVVHINHPREVTPEFAHHIGILVDRGIPVLSQTVLLHGVNDQVTTLAELFKRLVESRIKPYYLHQLDRAPGTNHFRVPIREGLRLMQGLRGHISGLCLPTYMLDIPGGHGKVPLGVPYVHAEENGIYEIVNHNGETFRYVEPD